MNRIVVTMATSEAEADLRDAMKIDPLLVERFDAFAQSLVDEGHDPVEVLGALTAATASFLLTASDKNTAANLFLNELARQAPPSPQH